MHTLSSTIFIQKISRLICNLPCCPAYLFILEGGIGMMTYDDYDMMYERLMYLKKNQNKLSLNERTKKVIEEIGKHPDAFEMYKGVFLTPDQVKNLQRFGINGKQASQYILNQCELRTKNSLELTYRYYGYVKPITPAILNQVIDDVATRVQLENEYARTVHAPSPQDEKEDQLTLNELGQFEH